jgi:hypothetical protein
MMSVFARARNKKRKDKFLRIIFQAKPINGSSGSWGFSPLGLILAISSLSSWLFVSSFAMFVHLLSG